MSSATAVARPFSQAAARHVEAAAAWKSAQPAAMELPPASLETPKPMRMPHGSERDMVFGAIKSVAVKICKSLPELSSLEMAVEEGLVLDLMDKCETLLVQETRRAERYDMTKELLREGSRLDPSVMPQVAALETEARGIFRQALLRVQTVAVTLGNAAYEGLGLQPLMWELLQEMRLWRCYAGSVGQNVRGMAKDPYSIHVARVMRVRDALLAIKCASVVNAQDTAKTCDMIIEDITRAQEVMGRPLVPTSFRCSCTDRFTPSHGSVERFASVPCV